MLINEIYILLELLRQSKGNLNLNVVERAAQMSGPYGQQLDLALTEADLASLGARIRGDQENIHIKDVVTFTETYKLSGLFECTADRAHRGVNPKYNQALRDPAELGLRLNKHAKVLDRLLRNVVR